MAVSNRYDGACWKCRKDEIGHYAIHQQNENIRLEFKSISITNRQNVATANQLREEASQRHHKWMIQHLGKETYSEFLKIDD